jgi:long-subunit fatty acid transport protein
VAASYKDFLSFGVTAQTIAGTAKFSQAAWSGTTAGTNPASDSIANIDVSRGPGSTWTGVVGATVRPVPALSVGASFRPGFQFDGVGTLTSVPPGFASQLGVKQVGDAADLILSFPPVARLGAQYRVSPRLLAEVDGAWEGWSVLQNVDIVPHDITIQSSVGTPKPLTTIHLTHNFVDAWSARVGADYVVLPHLLTLRAGYLWESSAIPSKDVGVDFANWGRNAVSVGASVTLWGATLDLAYAHHFVPTQTVTDSEIRQVTTPSPFDGPTRDTSSVVGNGTYEASYDIFSLGLTIPFDELHKSMLHQEAAAPAPEPPAAAPAPATPDPAPVGAAPATETK